MSFAAGDRVVCVSSSPYWRRRRGTVESVRADYDAMVMFDAQDGNWPTTQAFRLDDLQHLDAVARLAELA